MPPRDMLLAVIVAIAWGSNFTAMKLGLEDLPPFLFVALRFTVLIPLIAVLPKPAGWGAILAVGGFINLGQFAFLFSAMQADVTAGLASLLIQSQAPITILLAALIFNERVGWVQAVGIGMAMVGMAILGLASGGNVTPVGLVLVLCGAVSWACGNVVLRRLPGVNMTALFVWASVVPPIPMFALSLMWEGTAPFATIAAMRVQAWLSVAYVAGISTLLGFSLWGALLARHRAADVTPFALLIPVFGIGVAAVMLGETITGGEALVTLIILAGLLLAVMGPRWWRV